jgi:hypothetical protein
MAKKKPQRIRVPSLPVLARRIAEIMVNHKVCFNEDYNEFLRRHTRYFDAIVRGDEAICAWHTRAKEMADEIVHGPKPKPDPNIDLAYQAGYDAAMVKSSFSNNPHQTSVYYIAWRDGWTDGMRVRGLVTRVNYQQTEIRINFSDITN